jgi:hypothetical protein
MLGGNTDGYTREIGEVARDDRRCQIGAIKTRWALTHHFNVRDLYDHFCISRTIA